MIVVVAAALFPNRVESFPFLGLSKPSSRLRTSAVLLTRILSTLGGQDWEADQNQQAQDPGENNPQQFKMLSTAQMSDPTKVPGIGTATAKHIIAALQAQPPPTNWREFSRITTTHGHRHFAKAPQRGLRARAPRLTAGARHAHSKPGHAANEWQLSIERQAYARRRRAKKLHLKGMSTEPRPQSLREDHGYHGERQILSKATKDSRRYPAATGGGDRRNDSK